jgi:hypothetical protein
MNARGRQDSNIGSRPFVLSSFSSGESVSRGKWLCWQSSQQSGQCWLLFRCGKVCKLHAVNCWTKCYSHRCKIFVPLKTQARFGFQECSVFFVCLFVCLACWSCSFELHEGSGECRRSIMPHCWSLFSTAKINFLHINIIFCVCNLYSLYNSLRKF